MRELADTISEQHAEIERLREEVAEWYFAATTGST